MALEMGPRILQDGAAHDVDAASAADATSSITSLCGSAIMYERHQLTTVILSSSEHFPWKPAGSFVFDIVDIHCTEQIEGPKRYGYATRLDAFGCTLSQCLAGTITGSRSLIISLSFFSEDLSRWLFVSGCPANRLSMLSCSSVCRHFGVSCLSVPLSVSRPTMIKRRIFLTFPSLCNQNGAKVLEKCR
jgi:hypothetical protein